MLENSFIVLYNKYLLKFNCHVYIESFRSSKAIKYIYKGQDKAAVKFNSKENVNLDEIKQFQGQLVNFEYPMHDRTNVIYRLAVHLPDERMVYFQDGEEETAAQRAPDAVARKYLYFEIPYRYVVQGCTLSLQVILNGSMHHV